MERYWRETSTELASIIKLEIILNTDFISVKPFSKSVHTSLVITFWMVKSLSEKVTVASRADLFLFSLRSL